MKRRKDGGVIEPRHRDACPQVDRNGVRALATKRTSRFIERQKTIDTEHIENRNEKKLRRLRALLRALTQRYHCSSCCFLFQAARRACWNLLSCRGETINDARWSRSRPYIRSAQNNLSSTVVVNNRMLKTRCLAAWRRAARRRWARQQQLTKKPAECRQILFDRILARRERADCNEISANAAHTRVRQQEADENPTERAKIPPVHVGCANNSLPLGHFCYATHTCTKQLPSPAIRFEILSKYRIQQHINKKKILTPTTKIIKNKLNKLTTIVV